MDHRFISFALSIIVAVSTYATNGGVAHNVNPFIGTGAVKSSLSGNNYPGATVPFGMVQLSPDTRDVPDWDCAAGYNYNDSIVYGFSHTRLSGTGASDFIDILMFPTIDGRNSSTFSHSKESAEAGYYQVQLIDENINAELTATPHTGIHRYTFPKQASHSQIILDLEHSANKGSWNRRIIQSQIKVVSPTVVEGYRIITGWAKLRKIYFHIEFSQPIESFSIADGERRYVNESIVNGTSLKANIHFNNVKGTPLISKVAISPVSIENAKLNMESEAKGWNFESYVLSAKSMWERELSKIQISGTDLQKEIFYTALYHTMIQPNVMSDVNGEYIGTDYVTRTLTKGDTHYSTFSLWDTFRAAHPLYSILVPQLNGDFVKSMIRQYDNYGYLPVWQLWGQDNYCMIGNHAIPVVVDAVMKCPQGIDVEKAYEAVLQSSITSHPNSPFDILEKYGYIPENIQSQSVSITLEQSYDDWCVAQLAKKLGKEDDYKKFIKRSEFYKNLYNSQNHFFQSKNDKGEWIEPFDPYKYGSNGGYPFTEGNAWQYYWYVPHDIPSLVSLAGGKKAFIDKLDTFFTTGQRGEQLNDNASGFIGQYAHGNEPSHHVAYLYNYVDSPRKTQYYVSKIVNELYDNTSAGYAGNDDCGEMSAWYIFSTMGFYPVNPADGIYAIGTPAFEECTISLQNGKTFTIKANKKSPKEIYIKSIRLNGKKLNSYFITHEDITNGGVLEFFMTK